MEILYKPKIGGVTIKDLPKQNEHRTSNVQHRILNGKEKETEIDIECSVYVVSFSFDVGRWKFDVRRSSFRVCAFL